MASISKQSKELQERHRKLLLNMLKLEENRECADCRCRNPTWASINLGIFVCIRCSGLHRQIGTHITKVRSCTMDIWEPDQIAFMTKMGNKNAKRIWEAQLPADYGKPSENEDDQLVLQWIRTKYEKRKFMHANPEAVLMEINNEAKAGGSSDAKNKKAATASASGATAAANTNANGPMSRKSKAITSPTEFARLQQQQQQQNVSSTSVVVEAEGFALDNNVASSFGGAGFSFTSGVDGNGENKSNNHNNGGGGFSFTQSQSQSQQQPMTVPPNSFAVPFQPQNQREETTTSSGFAFVSEGNSSNSNGGGGGGFGFVTSTSSGNNHQTNGFSFTSASMTNQQHQQQTPASPLSVPVSADDVVDALFSSTKPIGALNFTNFVSASPINPTISSSVTATNHVAPPTPVIFDPFACLANMGQLKQTHSNNNNNNYSNHQNEENGSFDGMPSSPASTHGFNNNDNNAGFDDHSQQQENFTWGNNTNTNNTNGFGFGTSNQVEKGFVQPETAGFGFHNSSNSNNDNGGFGFASVDAGSNIDSQPHQSPEVQAMIEQLKKQQELLMAQMAQLAGVVAK